mgnify:CR=1 FL=1
MVSWSRRLLTLGFPFEHLERVKDVRHLLLFEEIFNGKEIFLVDAVILARLKKRIDVLLHLEFCSCLIDTSN